MASLGVKIQERDLLLLRGLFECRLMALRHIVSLYFEGNEEVGKKRIQKLKAAGLVGERPRRLYEPSILFLTRKAFLVLSEHGILREYPSIGLNALERRAQGSELTLKHELAVMDVKAAFTNAFKDHPTVSLVEFSTWPLLFQFSVSTHMGENVVKPDGFIRIHERLSDGTCEHAYFFELDRSSESQSVLAAKAQDYGAYYRTGGFAVRHGHSPDDYKQFPFRVLMVFNNAERRNNATEKLLQLTPPVLTQVWLTTFEEITKNPLGNIWIRPIDYREATTNTEFDVERRRRLAVYRREPARDLFIAETVLKSSFFLS